MENRMNEVLMYCLWFHLLPISEKIKYKWWQETGSCKNFFEADSNIYIELGIDLENIHMIEATKENHKTVIQLYTSIQEQEIHVIGIDESEYPIYLKEIVDPPFVLFWKGNTFINKPALAIVGSRKCSEYGYQAAIELGYELTKAGFLVVSGMARGIDEAAHKGALKIGETLAVLGTSVDICYPKQNYKLYQDILHTGCVVSEFVPPTEPRAYQFPKRNRIISGMTLGTIVVEASERSGSLITARLALEQNREVFAVPGNFNSALSKGSHRLIQSGAKLVTCGSDIVQEIMPQISIHMTNFTNNCVKIPTQILDKVEIMVYDYLSWQPKELVNIANQMNMTEITIEKILLKLEIKGIIMRLPGRRYVRLN
ncbi:DNA-processing protein DprA [Niameybacter massiliensis]|uniref:DNA-processing protein DprA n=1 Tax=Niameybacter massiliensis TaxID=1658108 RepID=UPI0006B65B21|nr:DNA-processing protein DprA [Niameybacter massiliensis]